MLRTVNASAKSWSELVKQVDEDSLYSQALNLWSFAFRKQTFYGIDLRPLYSHPSAYYSINSVCWLLSSLCFREQSYGVNVIRFFLISTKLWGHQSSLLPNCRVQFYLLSSDSYLPLSSQLLAHWQPLPSGRKGPAVLKRTWEHLPSIPPDREPHPPKTTLMFSALPASSVMISDAMRWISLMWLCIWHAACPLQRWSATQPLAPARSCTLLGA